MRFGMIGAGGMARLHAAVLSSIKGMTVVAFADPQLPPAAIEMAHKIGADTLASAEELLARQDIDAVVIAVPTDLHGDMAIAAARAGKHIFCEKPLARTIAQAEALIAETEKAGVKLAVGHVVRYFSEYAAARDMVLRGELGTPGMVRATRGGSFPFGTDSWFASFERSGGVVIDVMIHEFDWLLWTFGPVERIFARGLSYANMPGKDMAMAVLRFRSGVIGYAEGIWAHPSGFRTSLEISGNGGLLRTDNQSTSTLQYDLFPAPDGTRRTLPPGASLEDNPYLVQMREVVRWFEGGPAPRSSAPEALDALRLGLTALDSIRTGQPVTFN
jgi:UDP-N-acetylglucosamine 3-dehydrogenase